MNIGVEVLPVVSHSFQHIRIVNVVTIVQPIAASILERKALYQHDQSRFRLYTCCPMKRTNIACDRKFGVYSPGVIALCQARNYTSAPSQLGE